MKKVTNNKSWILLAALVSTNIFAASAVQLKFDLSNKDEADAKAPWFYCTVVNDKAAIPVGLLGTKINIQIPSAPISFANHVREYNSLSASDLKNKYFEVVKGDMQGEGIVTISASKDSDIECVKGDKGGRPEVYTQ